MDEMNIKGIMGAETRSLLNAMESSSFVSCNADHILICTPDGKQNRFQRLTRWDMVSDLVDKVNPKHKDAASLVGIPASYFPDAMRGQRTLPRNTILSLLLVTQHVAEDDPECLSHMVLRLEQCEEDIEESWTRTAASYTRPWNADIAEVQHTLMVARVAGLYRNQSLEDTRRNLVLQHLFTWKLTHPELFRDLSFAESVLKYCGCAPLKQGRSYTPPKISKQIGAQLNTLREDLKLVKRVDAFRRRSALCCGYFGVSCPKEISAAQRITLELQNEWGDDAAKLSLFLKEDNNTTIVLTPRNREALIHYALVMGAGYEELQRMLIEAGCSVLYPRSYDDQDLEYIRYAMENDKNRKESNTDMH